MSRGFNQYIKEERSLWRPYLKPETIETAKESNQSLSVLFGSDLEGLTEEGLQLHPTYGPLYQALKAKVDAYPFFMGKGNLLREESRTTGRRGRDITYIILSNDYFKEILLEDCRAGGMNAQYIIEQCDHKTMLLGLQWLLQSTVLQKFSSTPIERRPYINDWSRNAQRSLDVALWGLKDEDLMGLLEEQYLDDPGRLVYVLLPIIRAHKNDELTLLILRIIIGKPLLLSKIHTDPTWCTSFEYLFPDQNALCPLWDGESTVESIFNQAIGLLESKITPQENQVGTTPDINRLTL